ncbi:MAG: hypothetical protein ACR2N1_07245, partial [Rubripirellula sp.]
SAKPVTAKTCRNTIAITKRNKGMTQLQLGLYSKSLLARRGLFDGQGFHEFGNHKGDAEGTRRCGGTP